MYKKRLVYSICLMLFIDELGGGIIFPVLPTLFINMELGFGIENSYFSKEILYSFPIILCAIGKIFGMPIFGGLADKYGYRRTIIFGLVAIIFCYLLSAISVINKNIELFLFSRFIIGFLSGTYAIGNALLSYVSSDDSERVSYFSLSNIAILCGFVVGPGLYVFIVDIYDCNSLAIPFIFAFILGVINLLLVLYNLKTFKDEEINIDKIQPSYRSYSQNINVKTITNNIIFIHNLFAKIKLGITVLGYLFYNKNTRFIALSFLAAEIGIRLYNQSLALFFTVAFDYPPKELGLFFTFCSFLMISSIYLLYPIINKHICTDKLIVISLSIVFILFTSRILCNITISDISINEYCAKINAVIFFILMPFIKIGFTNIFARKLDKADQGKCMGGEGQISSLSTLICGITMGVLFTISYNLILIISTFFVMLSYILINNIIVKN